MKKLVWIVGAALAGVTLFGAGFFTGRQFPAHHYQKFSNAYLYDSSTGRLCAIFPDNPGDSLTQALKSGWLPGQGVSAEEFLEKNNPGRISPCSLTSPYR